MRSIARNSMVRATFVSLTGIIALFFVTGCGGGKPLLPSLSGTWIIVKLSAPTSPTFAKVIGTGKLIQNGNSVSGTFALSGSPCASRSSKITGTVTGTSLSLQLQEGDQSVSLTGTVDSGFTKASGTYTTPSEGCLKGDFGDWTASKQPLPPSLSLQLQEGNQSVSLTGTVDSGFTKALGTNTTPRDA